MLCENQYLILKYNTALKKKNKIDWGTEELRSEDWCKGSSSFSPQFSYPSVTLITCQEVIT